MDKTEVLQLVKREMNINDQGFKRYEKDIQKVYTFLEEKHIEFEERNLIAFTSHVITLFIRLESGEKVNGMDEEVMSQLDEAAIKITYDLMKIIADIYGEADVVEVALVAIHIQTAMEIMQDKQ